MARINIAALDMIHDEARRFMEVFNHFMKTEINPDFLGATAIDFHIELAQNGGYDIICETNMQMNEGSRSFVRTLTRGFIGGFQSRTGQLAVIMTCDGKLFGSLVRCNTREEAEATAHNMMRKLTPEKEEKINQALNTHGFYEWNGVGVYITELAQK